MMRKHLLAWTLTGTMALGMAFSGPAWAGETEAETEESSSLLGLIGSLVSEEGGLNDLLGENADLDSLLNLYEDIEKKSKKTKAPALMHAEQSLLFRTVRDLLMKDVDRVFVNDQEAFEKLKSIADVMAPKLKPRILYKDTEALFDRYDTEAKIENALARQVWLKSGGYLVIDRAEAMTIIDVNTGKYVGKDNLEKTITNTNCEAAKEIAVQLRLRDIGGIVIIDFIDMEKEADRQKVLQTLKDAMRDVHTRSHVFGFTHLGLVERTRK